MKEFRAGSESGGTRARYTAPAAIRSRVCHTTYQS